MDITASSSAEESSATPLPNSGRFAWTIIGSTCVPCLFRQDKIKYVPIRIVHEEVLSQFFGKLILEGLPNYWSDVETFSLTKAESDLLNQINKEHCDMVFGTAEFNENDKIVKLDDLIEYYDFLDTSYSMLLSDRSSDSRFYKCGFVRINNDNNSIVPYVLKNNQKYLPIFYFDDETKSLEAEAITLENLDLAYLKLCCKAQGIKDDLIAGDKFHVTSLEQIKVYFTKDTEFDDFWPADALKTLQSSFRVEANSNHSQRPAPLVTTAGTQQSMARVEVEGNHSRGRAPPAYPARSQQSVSRVEVDQNDLRRPAPAGSVITAPPVYYGSSVSSKKQNRLDTPLQPSPYSRTNSFAPTMNSSSYARSNLENSGSNIAMTNSPATTFSRPYPPTQTMRQPSTVQKKNSDPRLKWQ